MNTHTVNMLAFNEGMSFGGDGTRSGNFFRNEVKPLLDANPTMELVVDMTGIDSMSDSFCHAFFVGVWMEKFKGRPVRFVGCNPLVKDFILFSKTLAEGDLENSQK